MNELVRRARKVGVEVASRHAAAVDRDARFPHESFAALREQELLGAMVPRDFGGLGASLGDIAAVCHTLGQYCANTAMIYAMHQIQVACFVQQGQRTPWHQQFMRRLSGEQLLLASATTEAGIGGDVRRSSCAMDVTGDRFRLSKHATVISYGEAADAILVTSRRHADSPPADQVITCVLKEDYRLEKTTEWDTLGMRGTCSTGYWLHAEGGTEQILPLPYADISARTMLPTTHILWAGMWLGIATDAVARAGAFIRSEARRNPGTTPPGALRLAEATAMLHQARGTVVSAIGQYERAMASAEELTSMSFAITMNTLKTSVSQMVVQVINHALLTCGLHGYRNDTDYSLGRHLRDAHSAAVMISNDRILANTSNMLLVHKEPMGLFA